jgi:hypothetical protein
MRKASDVVLERAKVREVAGVFHSREALDAAVNALLLAGFDRADIDRLASLDQVREKLGYVYVAPEELAEVSRVPRQPFVGEDDISVTLVVASGTFGALSAMLAALAVIASRGGWLPAVVAATLAGAIAVIAAFVGVKRLLAYERRKGLEAHMATRGLILWVRVRSPEEEARAQEILLAHGGRAVRVHEIAIEKRAEDLPLASLRPDPWLGSEPLGHP